MAKYLKNNAKDGVPELILVGDICGYDAMEISYELRNTTAEKIRVKINSYGGYMMAGYSIISAFQDYRNAGGVVETIAEGYAMSCASWVLSMGNKGNRSMYNYGEVMIHAPVLGDKYYTDITDPEEKEMMDRELDKIVMILMASTNYDSEDELRQALISETTFTAEEAMKMGFVDNIIQVSNVPASPSNRSPENLVNSVLNLNNKKNDKDKNPKNMKKVALLLNLNAEASEGAIYAEIQKSISQLGNLTKEKNELKVKADKLEAENTSLKEKVSELESKEIVEYVDSLVTNGVIGADQKDSMLAMAKNDFKSFKALTENKAPAHANIDEKANEAEPAGSDELENAKKFKNMSFDEKEALKESDFNQYIKLANSYDKNFLKLM